MTAKADGAGRQEPEQRLIRVVPGRSLPQGWRFVQWVGKETGLAYAPGYEADVVLVEADRG